MRRRDFLIGTARLLGASAIPPLRQVVGASVTGERSSVVTLFLCGDVMTGRGIDQILAHPGDPTLHESYIKDARRYVDLAEEVNGSIPRSVAGSYIWGESLAEIERRRPEARIVNLETAVTRSDDHWPRKGINYRMHPDNLGCLTVAGIDCCVLANNHVLDWGYAGLAETLATVERAGIETTGAGSDVERARAPAIVPGPEGRRVVVFACGSPTSGIPPEWAAAEDRPGVSLVTELSDVAARDLAARVAAVKRPGDVAVVSIHWGGNWGYPISPEQRRFAHALVDIAGVDVVHGHSSHHPVGIEVYDDRPILYGCGDFINDYEGIGGYERFRGDLALAYFVTLERSTGKLDRLVAVPFQSRRLRLERPSPEDVAWLRETLDREGRILGTRVDQAGDGDLELSWDRRDEAPRLSST
jgi:poly-gamma-glutamate synthesis protein (capsule biosynthesis protein)